MSHSYTGAVIGPCNPSCWGGGGDPKFKANLNTNKSLPYPQMYSLYELFTLTVAWF